LSACHPSVALAQPSASPGQRLGPLRETSAGRLRLQCNCREELGFRE